MENIIRQAKEIREEMGRLPTKKLLYTLIIGWYVTFLLMAWWIL